MADSLRSLPMPDAPMSIPVTVGSLVSRTFATWSQNLLRFAVVAVVIQIPSLLMGQALGSPLQAGLYNPLRPSPELKAFQGTGAYWLLLLVTSLLGLVQTGALTVGALNHLAGRRATIGEMLASGLRRAGPVMLAGLLAHLSAYLGLILLVVPGIIVGIMFSLIVPVVVSERLGTMASLARSRRLTEGHRSKLLGLLSLVYVIGVAPGLMVYVGVIGVPPAAAVVMHLAVNAVMGPLVMAASAVAYHDLRNLKEGGNTAALERVFE